RQVAPAREDPAQLRARAHALLRQQDRAGHQLARPVTRARTSLSKGGETQTGKVLQMARDLPIESEALSWKRPLPAGTRVAGFSAPPPALPPEWPPGSPSARRPPSRRSAS